MDPNKRNQTMKWGTLIAVAILAIITIVLAFRFKTSGAVPLIIGFILIPLIIVLLLAWASFELILVKKMKALAIACLCLSVLGLLMVIYLLTQQRTGAAMLIAPIVGIVYFSLLLRVK